MPRRVQRALIATALPPSPYVPISSGYTSTMVRVRVSATATHLLERRVRREHGEVAVGQRRRERVRVAHVARPGCAHRRDPGVDEPQLEVGGTLTEHTDGATGEDLEGHVPQPRRVGAVLGAGVDAERDDGVGL